MTEKHRQEECVVTTEELQFFDAMPQLRPIYIALREKLEETYPDMGLKITKTQISLRNRYVFGCVSLPTRRLKGWPKEYLLVSFGLNYRKQSPRIAQAVEAYPGRWTHHVPLTRAEEVDEELLSWLDEAYQFAMIK